MDRKRRAEEPAPAADAPELEQPMRDLVFADPYEDVIESESEGGEDEGDEDADDEVADGDAGGAASSSAAGAGAPSKASKAAGPKAVWRPGVDTLGEGETLEHDPSAYIMLHAMSVEWPCLSFDIVPDRLGAARTKLPLTATFIAGTQADTPGANKLLVMRATNLCKTQEKPPRDDSDDDDSSDDDDEDDEDEPVLYSHRIPHPGGVNRVRVMPQEPHVTATWADTGKVHLWDIRGALRHLDAEEGKALAAAGGTGASSSAAPPPAGGGRPGPLFTFSGHRTEGYGLDWSPAAPGRLASADCAGVIQVWDCNAGAAAALLAARDPGSGPEPATVWSVADGKAGFGSHTGSVEDIQWSPNEATVFATCSADRTVRIWDTRAKGRAMITVEAAACDVNVISWSRLVSFLLASGNDDGSFRVWDLRSFKGDSSVAQFRWHTKQVTSIEWAFDDENVLVVGAADNQVTLWDLSLEGDDDAEVALAAAAAAAAAGGKPGAPAALPSARDPGMADIPPQLLFLHAGQEDVKEVHFHRQLPGVIFSTAADGFNVFRPDLQLCT